MRDKIKALIVACVMVGVSIIGINAYAHESPNNVARKVESGPIRVIESHANYKQYDDLQSLEQDSEIIVEAKFNGNRETIHFEQNGQIIDSVSKSQLVITKVYKGDFSANDIISVYEPGFYADPTIYVPTEGYNLIKEKGRQLLFLKRNPADDVLVIIGGYQGKFDLDIKEVGKKTDLNVSDYIGDDVEHFQKLKKEIIGKYDSK